ncbi:DUF4331 domain-containing protein [Prosthecodimorpha hirschii]|uniref:DUF4331 domain-containing protein n=1 Tax=Prosthecodimorpha hirschii TaxID=665126 RepID=UPI0015E4234C|nr:DUF4331 domain-containing protein [Prosthecomicrobium hirschii]
MMKSFSHGLAAAGFALSAVAAAPALASSHMDAPLISLDDPANTTDVYAFISRREGSVADMLTVALAVYPFEEPGIGPNNYRFDDAVTYDLHVALDGDIAKGRPDLTYRFEFTTTIPDQASILQTYLGALEPQGVGQFATNQNLRQTYTVTQFDWRKGDKGTVLGTNLTVPPNNQGRVTRYYNQGDDGDMPAKPGVATTAALDPFTRNAIASIAKNHRVFAGQRDDGFYGDIQSIFDLDFTFGRDRSTPTKPFDSQGGYNVHTIALEIPVVSLSGAKFAGVYATTSRSGKGGKEKMIQVGRQGNPLFVEALLANMDKDKYNRSAPKDDGQFGAAVDNPQLSQLFSVTPIIPGLLRSIYVPDMIRVDLTTGPARLAGKPGFHRLGVFGGDVLQSTAQDPFANGGKIPGGWPNGRRFGDDVIDIAIIALGIAGAGPDYSAVDIDRVTDNDITYNQVFPYAATPLNGRVHGHHASTP